MVAIIPPQTVMTPAGAANDLQSHGLDALGLAAPNLSPVWSSNPPGVYSQGQLTLQMTNVRAPFRGIREFAATPTFWSGVDGMPVAGPVAVFRLHPEAARRLAVLAQSRYGTPLLRPVPVAMVVRGITLPATIPVPEWYFAGDALDTAGSVTISFHDHRGLPVDPIAAADMFRDLQTWRPALVVAPGGGTLSDPGGLNNIKTAASGTLVHVIDPHGWGYTPTRPKARLKVLNGTNEVSPVPDGGLVTLTAGQTLGRSAADNTADGTALPLCWGWALNGTLARTALTPPVAATLSRGFFRVMAVDLDWHLIGNRSTSTLAGVPGDDDATPDFLLPQVRDPVPNFAYLTDGNDILGAAATMTAGFPAAGASTFAIAVSPVLTAAVTAPPSSGPPGHWPVFPAPNSGAGLTAATNPRQGIAATWRNLSDGPNADWDIIVTVASNAVPDGAHVRVFPRQFVEIDAIAKDAPSFVRGDGGSAIATAGNATKILLVNPLALKAGDTRPATVSFDIVVTARSGERRLFSEVRIAVAAGPLTWTDNIPSFGGATILAAAAMQAILDGLHMRGICPSPLFGVPRTFAPAPGAPSGVIGLLRKLASESQPRQGPRLPTQMRFETMLVIGTNPAANQPLGWRAVLTGARWSFEARSYRPDLGNPGNPAGADVHATGVSADGWLAYDLALHAVKRAQPIVPFGADAPSWLVATGGNNWNPPPADSTGTVSAVMLETVAAICDTPELSLAPVPAPGDTIGGLISTIASAMGVPAPTINVTNGNQLVTRVQREIVSARSGLRDTLWSLRRALSQAREFIYIEGPAFSKTARPSGAPQAWEVDLVDLIRQRMVANPRLKVAICVPRWADFEPGHAGWVRAALKHRKDAIEQLTSTDRNRVAAFHPIGFPGRPAAIRSTTVIVDDVWCLVGTSHIRRRGMTFDGSVDVASIDRTITNGYSAAIRQFRQRLMAHKLGVAVPAAPAAATPLWIRLGNPDTAFDAVADLLAQGGLGRCAPVWAGPTDASVLPSTDDVADPDGANGASFVTLLAGLLSGE